MRRHVALAATGLAAVAAAAQPHGFTLQDDLLAFPQFQVAFPETYILEADAQSKLDFTSSISSAKAGAQTTESSESDNAPSIRTAPGSRNSHGPDSDFPELPQSYEHMILDKTPYLCSIPQVEEDDRNSTKSATDEEDAQKELDRARIRGSELIGAMDDNCLYYIGGWWSYSFCYNSEVRQFHQLPPGRNGVPFHPPVEDENVPSFILGQFTGPKKMKHRALDGGTAAEVPEQAPGKTPQKATDLVQVSSKGNFRYLVQKLDDGTPCDLTGKPRRIEVQYHCNPQTKDRISWIKETSTCNYLMVVYTSRLCDDMAFSPPPENEAHQIVCREIVPEDNLDEWKAQKPNEKMAELIAQGEAANKARKQLDGKPAKAGDAKATPGAEGRAKGPIIGGIELGGQKTVGMPGKILEPPLAFTAPYKQAEKTHVIVKFDPKKNDGKWVMLSDKDLKKLQVDPEIAEQMAQEMHDYAQGRKWRIELGMGEEGEELRGIIDEEVEAENSSKKKGDSKAKAKSKQRDADEDAEGDEFEGSEEEYFKEEL